jgi:predicted aspartyl protease
VAVEPGSRLVASDDLVAPKTRRVTAARIIAVGLTIMVVALLGLLAGLQHQSDLSAVEQQQIREVIAERKAQRDTEQARVQLQLDEQGRALCTVLVDFRRNARTPEGRASIQRALDQLECARILRLPEGAK